MKVESTLLPESNSPCVKEEPELDCVSQLSAKNSLCAVSDEGVFSLADITATRSSSSSSDESNCDDGHVISGLRMYDCMEDTKIFRRESSVQAISQLHHKVLELLPHDHEFYSNLRLKWPEFLEPTPQKALKTSTLSLTLRFASESMQTAGLQHVKVICATADTPRTVLVRAFAKFKLLMGISARHSDDYALKVTGFKDFLLRLDVELCQYQYINTSVRSGSAIDLSIIELCPEEVASRNALMKYEAECLGTDIDFSLGKSLDVAKPIPPRTDRMDWPFRLRVVGIENLPQAVMYDSVMITFALRFGNTYLSVDSDTAFDLNLGCRNEMFLHTAQIPFSASPRWRSTWLVSPVYGISTLPSSACLECTVFGIHRFSQHKEIICGVKIPLVDAHSRLLEGKHSFRMWGKAVADRSYNVPENLEDPVLTLPSGFPIGESFHIDGGTLHVCFDTYASPILRFTPTLSEVEQNLDESEDQKETITEADKRRLLRIAKLDSLHPLSSSDKALLWKARHHCKHFAKLLPKFLRAVNWTCAESTTKARRILLEWQKPSSLKSLVELVSGNYPDPFVRAWAANMIGNMHDAELSGYLVQLVQSLKHETQVVSPLACMLLVRCLQNPSILGHKFFWLIRNETQRPEYCDIYSAILAVYCMKCGHHWRSLRNQVMLVEKLETIAQQLKHTSREDQMNVAAEELKSLNSTFSGTFEICLSPRFEAKRILIERTRIMDSKKQPLWLGFENADGLGKPIYAIFKCGDDLRQDLMTLQMLKLMDNVWQAENLDLRLKPYLCQATSQTGGMIEVIEDATTTAKIHLDFGGSCFGPLMETPIDSFLKESSKGNTRVYDQAVDNFIRSCAGYCVATYVMGIGDRHSDNIMVAKNGQLFHIDFGHFLGNFKSRFGVNRERAPLVFTPEMAFVMGTRQGARFCAFEEMCCKAYNILRRHGQLFISLFSMMVPAGVPELTAESDVLYMREMLSMDLSEANAAKKFKREIQNALSSQSRRIDNWMHSIYHGSLLDKPAAKS